MSVHYKMRPPSARVPGPPADVPSGFGPAAGFVVVIATSLLVVATGGTRHTAAALAVYALASAAAGLVLSVTDGIVTAALCWFFLDGFVVGRSGHLEWHGSADATRIGLLLGAALAGHMASAVIRSITRRRPR
ncbi:MAG: hypothetical protein HOV68_04225, partial [Streptomycetaceae bacterium]|nr:hypothetical protein [Streptomycetaceae bacterium]